MRILITGSNTFYGARLVQALGGADCAVTAADSVRDSCGKVSRHARGRLDLPSLRSDPTGYLAALVNAVRGGDFDALLPSFEESVLLCDHREALEPHVRTFLPEPGTAWRMHHKGHLHEFCLEHDIPTPETVVLADGLDWSEAAEHIAFPAFVKPVVGLGSLGRSFCGRIEDVDEADRGVRACRDGVESLLQQAVDGPVVSTLMFCHEGRVLGEVAYRSLRTIPDDGGISCHRESVDEPEVSRIAHRVCEFANWTGFVGMDFVVDAKTGVPHLVDFNPRATPALQLGFVAGVDWARIVCDLLAGRDPEPAVARPGLRARSVVFDVGWLIDGFCGGKGWLRRGSDRLRDFLRPKWTLDSSIDLVDSKDWRPKVAMFKYAISCIVGSAVRRRAFGDLLFHESTYDRNTAARVAPPVPRDATGSTPRRPAAVVS